MRRQTDYVYEKRRRDNGFTLKEWSIVVVIVLVYVVGLILAMLSLLPEETVRIVAAALAVLFVPSVLLTWWIGHSRATGMLHGIDLGTSMSSRTVGHAIDTLREYRKQQHVPMSYGGANASMLPTWTPPSRQYEDVDIVDMS